MKAIANLLMVLILLNVSVSAHSKVLWQDFRLTYLNGDNYRVGDNARQVWTFEHASKSTWGDSFLFFDRLNYENGESNTYGEFSPRIKLLDTDSFVKSIYFAPSVEMSSVNNYLIGIGTDIDLPYFNYFQVNFYHRNNGVGDSSFQTTLTWGIPLGPFYYDGFLDYATGATQTNSLGMTFESADQMNFTSQLKYDIAPHFNLDNKLYIGIEYVFWNNKFGIEDSEPFRTDERNVNLLVKMHF